MPPNLEVEDSQIIEYHHFPSEDDPNYPPLPSHELEVYDGKTQHCVSHINQSCHSDTGYDDAKDSISSKVEETQFQSIELAHDQGIWPIVVNETQYTTIEPNIQTPCESVEYSSPHNPISPGLEIFRVPAETTTFSDALKPPVFAPISRSNEALDDAAASFSFTKALKPPKFSRIIGAQCKAPSQKVAHVVAKQVDHPRKYSSCFGH